MLNPLCRYRKHEKQDKDIESEKNIVERTG